jgi:dTDP-4-amino-4,6-dideoxygalactose transaminase
MSGRMDNLRAAILRPQLAKLEDRIERWNERYRVIERALRCLPRLELPVRPKEERFVGSSLQFRAPGLTPPAARDFVAATAARGVELKWFGAEEPLGFTSNHHHWTYVDEQDLPRTDAILAGLFDMRLPLTFSLEDCAAIGAIIADRAERCIPDRQP